jgi:hypothetical protein
VKRTGRDQAWFELRQRCAAHLGRDVPSTEDPIITMNEVLDRAEAAARLAPRERIADRAGCTRATGCPAPFHHRDCARWLTS